MRLCPDTEQPLIADGVEFLEIQGKLLHLRPKIEQNASQQIVASDMGQAHNQLARAQREYGTQGYVLRGTIVTHLTAISPQAEASAGSIKVLKKGAIFDLWNRVRSLLSLYRDGWSLDDISARSSAAQTIRARLPETGWIIRALDADERFITTERLLSRMAMSIEKK